ncbi:MAG TPA: efflux RND transporter periplasmic adaptor subunit [Gemmataceae bacterium]|nr:efflux RND transporter periplasmic adaptor subunit [Gemmataceae bacterium]
MFTRLRSLSSMLLGLVPTVLTLALLGAIAWWGYIWDWKIPTLPELLNPSAERSRAEKENEGNDEKKTEERQSADNSLPTIHLSSEEKLKAAGVTTKPVEERLIDEFVTAHGHVDFDQNRYAHLSTRASGTASSVFKQMGDEVKKGDVLALIACPELARLKFDLQQTLLTVQTRQVDYDRLKMAGTSTALKDLKNAEFALRDARIALSKNQQSLQNLGLNVSLDGLTALSDEQVASRLRTLGIPDSLLQRLDESKLTNNLLPMYAPFDGMVVHRDIVKGEMVDPTKPQFILADLSQLWICLHARLEDVGRLREGMEVAFHLDGPNEDAPPAKIKWISAEVDEKTRTVAVRADVSNPKGRLRPNSFGDARILVDRKKLPIVPNEALQAIVSHEDLQRFDKASHVVFVEGASPTEFQPRPVQLGPRYEKYTVILSGIKAGETIAVSGSHVLLSEMQRERIGGDD